MALEREMEVFQRELPSLLAKVEAKGRYALVGGTPPELVGVFPTDEEAIETGYARFGLAAAFLVKLVADPEPPKFFSRNIRSCPT